MSAATFAFYGRRHAAVCAKSHAARLSFGDSNSAIHFSKYEVWRLQRLARMIGGCKTAEERAKLEQESHHWRYLFVFAIEEVLERCLQASFRHDQEPDLQDMYWRQMMIMAAVTSQSKRAKKVISTRKTWVKGVKNLKIRLNRRKTGRNNLSLQ
jgi:hypothetical protein